MRAEIADVIELQEGLGLDVLVHGEPERNEHFEHWFDRAEQKPGSWWDDWVTWLRPQCGAMVAPLSPASSDYPALAPAPGTFVHEK